MGSDDHLSRIIEVRFCKALLAQFNLRTKSTTKELYFFDHSETLLLSQDLSVLSDYEMNRFNRMQDSGIYTFFSQSP